MKEKPHNTWSDPELEARIVTLVLAEATDLEREELEILIEQRPELAAFKKQMEFVHGSLEYMAASETNAEDNWKLSDERRSAVLAVIADESGEKPTIKMPELAIEKREPIDRGFSKDLGKIAAVLCVMGGLGGAVLLFSISDQFAQRGMLARSTDIATAESDLSGDSFSVPSDSYRYDDAQINQPLSDAPVAIERDHAIDSKSALAAIRGSLDYSAAQTPKDSSVSEIADAGGRGGEGFKSAEPNANFSLGFGRAAKDEIGKFADFDSDGLLSGVTQPVEPQAGNGARAFSEDIDGRYDPNTSVTRGFAKPTAPREPALPGFTADLDAPFRRGDFDNGHASAPAIPAQIDSLSAKPSEFGKQESEPGGQVLANSGLEMPEIRKYEYGEDRWSRVAEGIATVDGRVRENKLKSSSPEGLAGDSIAFHDRRAGETSSEASPYSSDWIDGEEDSARQEEYDHVASGTMRLGLGDNGSRRGMNSIGGGGYGDLGLDRNSDTGSVVDDNGRTEQGREELLAAGTPIRGVGQRFRIDAAPSTPTPTGEDYKADEEYRDKQVAENRREFGIELEGRVNLNSYGLPATRDVVQGELQKQVQRSLGELSAVTQPGISGGGRGSWSFSNRSDRYETRDSADQGKVRSQKREHAQADPSAEKNLSLRKSGRQGIVSQSLASGVEPQLLLDQSESMVQGPMKKPVASIGLNETNAKKEPFSTFSLHVSDVSFKLAWASLSQGKWPEAGRIRLEEFVNAFDYGDPMPSQSEKVACRLEQSSHPFLQQRNLLRVSLRTAAAGRSSDTPLRLTFLLDNSGSMERADRQQTVRRAFTLLAQQLTPADQVTLISFARQPRLLADKVSGAQSQQLVERVQNLPSEGGTNIEAALQLALEKAKEQHLENAQNRVILLTDGAVNLGDADPQSLAQMIATMRGAGIAFDAAGISAAGLNDEVLEALTRNGDGRYYLLDRPEDADEGFVSQLAGALRPAAKNVKVQIEFNPKRVGRYKLLGYEKHRLQQEDFRNDQVDAAEMAAAEAGVALYQFEAKPDGEGDVGSVSVRFRDVSTGQMVESRWPIPYEADAPRANQAAPSLRIATSAALLAAKLRGEPLGETVDLTTLSQLINGLPDRYRNAKRVHQLQQMIHQARQIGGI